MDESRFQDFFETRLKQEAWNGVDDQEVRPPHTPVETTVFLFRHWGQRLYHGAHLADIVDLQGLVNRATRRDDVVPPW